MPEQSRLVFLNKYKYTLIGILLGAFAGYAHWHFIGCANGRCLITSKPINSSLYGALMGGLLGNIIKDFINKNKTN
jgi:outer membrane lipoprotein SlyB